MTSTDTIDGHRVDHSELFDGSQYDVRPVKDGFRPDVIRLAIGGQIERLAYDPEWIEFVSGLRLGQELTLNVSFTVSGSGWRHALKGEDQEDNVIHQVALKAHTITLPVE